MSEPIRTVDDVLIEAANQLCRFVEENMPAGWQLDLSMSKNEAYLTLTDPDGEEHERPTADAGVSSIRDACEIAAEITRRRAGSDGEEKS